MNEDAVEKVIRYITRTRKNEDRADELITWGGMGVGCYASSELVIERFRAVQEVYGKKQMAEEESIMKLLGFGRRSLKECGGITAWYIRLL